LQDGMSTFSNISDENVLMEVLNHEKGMKYLNRKYNIKYIFFIVTLLNYFNLNRIKFDKSNLQTNT